MKYITLQKYKEILKYLRINKKDRETVIKNLQKGQYLCIRMNEKLYLK